MNNELKGVIEDNSFNVKVQIAESGPRGLPGNDGYTPIKGTDYFDGIKGADGLSAYEVAVKNGFEGTEQEWANSLGGFYTLPVATQTLLGGIMVGENLKIVGGVLSVDTATEVEQDNTRPVTSAAVHTELGNIEVLLASL